MRYLTCDPSTETLGGHIQTFLESLHDHETRPVMEKYGLLHATTDQWIPTLRMMDALNELAEDPDFVTGLFTLGIETGRAIPVSPLASTLGDALLAWNDAYHAAHRNADVGKKECTQAGENHYQVTFTDLYPDDFNYGIMYGFAQRFLPPGTNFMVYYDTKHKPRDRGGEDGFTIIHIKWS